MQELDFSSHYSIIGKLGQGTGGEVYKVIDKKGDTYAAKFPLPGKVYNQYVKNEASTLSQLNSIHFPKYYGTYNHNGSNIYVMQYIEGRTLDEITETDVTEEILVKVLEDIAVGLDMLHAKGLTHGDLTSENVMITPSNKAILIDINGKWQCFDPVDVLETYDEYLDQCSEFEINVLADIHSFGSMLQDIILTCDDLSSTFLNKLRNIQKLCHHESILKRPTVSELKLLCNSRFE